MAKNDKMSLISLQTPTCRESIREIQWGDIWKMATLTRVWGRTSCELAIQQNGQKLKQLLHEQRYRTSRTQVRAGLEHQAAGSQTIWREGMSKAIQELGRIKISVESQALDRLAKQDGDLITICKYMKDTNTKKGVEEYN